MSNAEPSIQRIKWCHCLLLLPLCLMVQISVALQQGRIIGGKLDTIENNPWLISVTSQEFGGHFCGGSLITPSWVLTAAHCLAEVPDKKSLLLRAGSDHKNSGGEIRKVRQMIIHPDYQRNYPMDYDYALMETRRPFELGPKIAVVQLASFEDILHINQDCKIAGWGVTNNPAQIHRPLKSAIVKVGKLEDCRAKYLPDIITNNMFCAGGNGNDACQGDSGGPIICGGKQFGIVSWGRECGLIDYYGIYASVTVIRRWIFDYTGV
ncbi:trypsin 3A1-like [Wyeomyia smithii]|uniref:trypsin 3A1-like n=1 Tax=Wyeomyia smithii TaxID=174621 RepID=UPI002467D02A|nr:trypsin 3A1-like [Wyeomyia smithii]